jgi:hypothetical protein
LANVPVIGSAEVLLMALKTSQVATVSFAYPIASASRFTTDDGTGAHQRLDRRRDDLCADGFVSVHVIAAPRK